MTKAQRWVVAAFSVVLAVVLFASLGQAALRYMDSADPRVLSPKLFGLGLPVLLVGVAAFVLLSQPKDGPPE